MDKFRPRAKRKGYINCIPTDPLSDGESEEEENDEKLFEWKVEEKYADSLSENTAVSHNKKNEEYNINDRVILKKNREGIIRFFGKVHFSKNKMFGIELIDGSLGKHDGAIDDLRYFQTAKNRAVFVKISGILCKMDRKKTISNEEKEEEKDDEKLFEEKEGNTPKLDAKRTIQIALTKNQNSTSTSTPYGSLQELTTLSANTLLNKELNLLKMNCRKIEDILQKNSLIICKNEYEQFEKQLVQHSYSDSKLQTALLDGLLDNKSSLTPLLPQRLRANRERRQLFCSILFYEYFTIKDIKKNENFIKILNLTIREIYPKVNIDESTNIAKQHEITGETFDGMEENEFVEMFKSLNGTTSKQWRKIYQVITEWKPKLDYKSMYECLIKNGYDLDREQYEIITSKLKQRRYSKTLLIQDLCDKTDDKQTNILYNVLKEEMNLKDDEIKTFCDILLYEFIKFDELEKDQKDIVDETKWNSNHIDFDRLCNVLNNNDFDVDEKHFELEDILKAEFYGYYNRNTLITDICDGLNNEKDDVLPLSQILENKPFEYNKEERKRFYGVVLHKFINVEELNNENFIKILLITVKNKYSHYNLDEIEIIAKKHKLNGRMFIKKNPEFKNSVKFAALFKSIKNYDRKELCKIYSQIKPWKQLVFYSDINYKIIHGILRENESLKLKETELNAFEIELNSKSYTQQKLINDLCDGYSLNNENETTLSDVLSTKFGYDQRKRCQFYYILLTQYITRNTKNELLNVDNFGKILKTTISNLYSYVDATKCQQIAVDHKLNGRMFLNEPKGQKNFKNSAKFAKLFESVNGYKRKEFANIYSTINRWELPLNHIKDDMEKNENMPKRDRFDYHIKHIRDIEEDDPYDALPRYIHKSVCCIQCII